MLPSIRLPLLSSPSSLRACLGVVTLALLAPTAVRADGTIAGFLAVRGRDVRAATSWRSGGFGRLPLAADGADQGHGSVVADGQVALRWEPTLWLAAYAQVAARAEPPELAGDAVSLVEAYLEARWYLRQADRLQLRLGAQLPATSLEATEPLWQSPFTLTLSALSTWIGEEVRPVGLDVDYQIVLGERAGNLRFGATAFGGNDTAGALLAWRGWSLGDRLTGYGEVVPLPPLASIAGAFGRQRDDGSKPFGRDLDGRLGWAGRLRWHRPTLAATGADSWVADWTLQADAYDNRGDRELYRGEYAWATSYVSLGGAVGWTHGDGRLTLVGEWLDGKTGMGDRRSAAFVDADLSASYVLVAWQGARWRPALRWDYFRVVDRDHSRRGEDNDEDGEAYTAALFCQLAPAWRVGGELSWVDARRPGLAAELPINGIAPAVAPRSRTFTVELRYSW
jgi:hypothetical protein